MESATKTPAARAKKAKAPQLPVTGTNPALDAAIAGAQALCQELRGFSASTPAEERALFRLCQRYHRGHDAVLSAPVNSLAEADVRLHAYLMGEALFYVVDEKQRRLTVKQAITILSAEDQGDKIGDALAVYHADVERLNSAQSWDAAAAAYLAARTATQPYYLEGSDELPDELNDVYLDARDAVIGLDAPDFAGLALKAGILAMQLGGIEVTDPTAVAAAVTGDDATEKLLAKMWREFDGLSRVPLAEITTFQWFIACLSVEAVARRFFRDEVHTYLINPDGVARMTRLITGIQSDLRDLVRDRCPEVIDAAYVTIETGRIPGAPDDDPPPPAASVPAAENVEDEWTTAVAAMEAAENAHHEACEAINHTSIPKDTLDAYYAANRRLMAVPAKSGAQLAYKLACHDEAPDFRDPEVIRYTEDHGDDNERAWLAVYRDALALSPPPSPAVDRAAWDVAAAAVRAAYEDHDHQSKVGFERLNAAVDELVKLTPPDLQGLRLLFDVIMTETQALGPRVADARHHGPEPLTRDLMGEACGWPKYQPCVYVEDGNGLSAGLVAIRRALDALVGDTTECWDDGRQDREKWAAEEAKALGLWSTHAEAVRAAFKVAREEGLNPDEVAAVASPTKGDCTITIGDWPEGRYAVVTPQGVQRFGPILPPDPDAPTLADITATTREEALRLARAM